MELVPESGDKSLLEMLTELRNESDLPLTIEQQIDFVEDLYSQGLASRHETTWTITVLEHDELG